MTQSGKTLQCPKCEKDDTYLVSLNKGQQFVCCKHCGNLMKAEVKEGRFTGKIVD